VSATSVFAASTAWALSFSGGSCVFVVFGHAPPWATIFRDALLWWQALGLAVVFLLALLAVRLWSAPPSLWLGALAVSMLLAASYVIRFIQIRWDFQAAFRPPRDYTHLLYSWPFNDPYVTLFALVGYPLAVGLGCCLGSRWQHRHAPARHQKPVSHA
jgi:hypothetical protein